MDLLGSILGTMQKPPAAGMTKEKELAKKEEEKYKKIHDAEKARLKKFRANLEDRINKFLDDERESEIVFPAMDKGLRAIIHDVVDVAGLVAFSFGIEDVDRHTVVYKKETVPNEDELDALRKGEVYDPEKVKQLKLQAEEEERERLTKPKKDTHVPSSNYSEKYEHIIGKDVGISAARATVDLDRQFGFVPSANKRDQRSIEQTLADIKKKKQKTQLAGPSVEGKEDEEED